MAREDIPGGHGRPPHSEVMRTEKAVASGSTAIMLSGIAAVVLVILSFIGVLRTPLAAIATIAIGLGLLLQGLALTRRQDEIRQQLAATGDTKAAGAVDTGMTAEFIAGIIGIALGILALFGVAPISLMAIAAIVFGIALIMGGPLTTRLDELNESSARIEGVSLEGDPKVVRTASGLEVLVGIAAVILGVLTLLGIANGLFLTLVALLITGAAIAFSGGIVARRAGPVAQ